MRADLKAAPTRTKEPGDRAATAASRARAAPTIELRPVNDLENQHPTQPVEVPGDDDYTLS